MFTKFLQTSALLLAFGLITGIEITPNALASNEDGRNKCQSCMDSCMKSMACDPGWSCGEACSK